jgi:putative SbcD/Mre11-related phosphoesterase
MRFIANVPAAVIGNALVVSDVHLGIEYELQRKGLRLYPRPKKVADGLNRLLRQFKCRQLIVLGDLKHDCLGFDERERKMMHEFLAALAVDAVTVCKGNHDSGLDGMPGITLVPAEGFVFTAAGKTYGMHHGHAWPAKALLAADVLLMGNNHPTILFEDALGHKEFKKAWIEGRIKASKKFGTRKQKAIVFPCYSQLSGGIAFNAEKPENLLGPLFKNRLFDVENATAVLLDGVRLGQILGLRKKAKSTRR